MNRTIEREVRGQPQGERATLVALEPASHLRARARTRRASIGSFARAAPSPKLVR
jgi:hypothetical protein